MTKEIQIINSLKRYEKFLDSEILRLEIMKLFVKAIPKKKRTRRNKKRLTLADKFKEVKQMPKLKVVTLYGVDALNNDIERQYYHKSEADKVIAEKDSEITKLKDEIHNLKRSLIVARHDLAKERRKKFKNKYRTMFKEVT